MYASKLIFFLILAGVSIAFIVIRIIDKGFITLFTELNLFQMGISAYLVFMALVAIGQASNEVHHGFMKDVAFKWVFALSFALAANWVVRFFISGFTLQGTFFEALIDLWLTVGIFAGLVFDYLIYDHGEGSMSKAQDLIVLGILVSVAVLVNMFIYDLGHIGYDFRLALGKAFGTIVSFTIYAITGYSLGFGLFGRVSTSGNEVLVD